jgi:hypothetical protein
VKIIRELKLSEISGVPTPAQEGALVLIEKSKEDKSMPPSLSETIAKALAPDAADSRRERENKAILKAGLESGAVSAEAVSAELVIVAKAKALAKAAADRGEVLSVEAATLRVLEAEPHLYDAVYGGR